MHARPMPQARLLLAAALLPALAGCSALGTLTYIVMPKDVPAEFAGLKGKHVAVVCKPIVELQFSDAGTSRELATTVGNLVERNVRQARVIPQDEVARWVDENTWVDYRAIGKSLDADLVVGIDLEEFRLHEGSTLLRGRATANVRVYDIAADKMVFEKRFDDFSFPRDGAIPVTDRPEAQFRGMFIHLLGQRISRCFHAYDSREQFADDNLSF
ncbi:MAG: hypothetical protein ACKO9B_03570 [Planctomycetota bacterium]|nr:hypothetical protein [Planctomycetota bacterium]MBU6275296.1 hypothetical protein [Planctomycetota bacterium]